MNSIVPLASSGRQRRGRLELGHGAAPVCFFPKPSLHFRADLLIIASHSCHCPSASGGVSMKRWTCVLVLPFVLPATAGAQPKELEKSRYEIRKDHDPDGIGK